VKLAWLTLPKEKHPEKVMRRGERDAAGQVVVSNEIGEGI